MHDETDTLERHEIIRSLRLGEIDVLVGINLLREGLDIPEVSLVAILDADQAGFLRSETTLVQTMGRAARNVNGEVVLYADEPSNAMESAIEETQRRREIQQEYNEEHGLEPTTIEKEVGETNLPGSKTDTSEVSGREIDGEDDAARYVDELEGGCRTQRATSNSSQRPIFAIGFGRSGRSSNSRAATRGSRRRLRSSERKSVSARSSSRRTSVWKPRPTGLFSASSHSH